MSSVDDRQYQQYGIVMTSQPINQSMNQENYSRIPKKNFLASSVFLNPSPDSRSLDEPSMNIAINNIGSQYFGKSCRSFKSRNSDGRIIEKETCTKQLQNGITETVTVMKEGNKKCVETITENSKTGETTENLQLSNLDKSQLNEFKNQFSRL